MVGLMTLPKDDIATSSKGVTIKGQFSMLGLKKMTSSQHGSVNDQAKRWCHYSISVQVQEGLIISDSGAINSSLKCDNNHKGDFTIAKQC